MASAGRRITTRQRWTPTPVQLQILDRIFDQETGTPSKQKIKDHITSELSQHGRISETNVYNWFQNRRLGLRGSNWGHYPTMLNQNKRRKLSHRMERRPSPAGIPLYQHNPAPRAEDLCMKMNICLEKWECRGATTFMTGQKTTAWQDET
ncbi:hypothetical protein V6N12_016534 [Hibiscus sabdariffa]|uniref:Homeobox domain-containing protein n=1 Tax=Hibiscus sabdariffa TaxID=183260 RepID=A0ABR2CEA6_9ROSI